MTGLFGDAPTWLDSEAWSAYCEWRDDMPKSKRWKPYARHLILVELSKLHAAGEDPTACLQQSMRNSWLDVYPVRKPKPAPFTALPANDAPVNPQIEQTRKYLESRDISPEEIKAAARRARELFQRRA